MQREPGLGESDRLLAVTTTVLRHRGAGTAPAADRRRRSRARQPRGRDGRPGARGAAVAEHGTTVMQATPIDVAPAARRRMARRPRLPRLVRRRAAAAGAGHSAVRAAPSSGTSTARPKPLSGRPSQASTSRRAGITIGRPIANTKVWVLDARWPALSAIGVPGEICIGGDGVGCGYSPAPGADRRTLRARPVFGPRPGARLYRTGDRRPLARRRHARTPGPPRLPGQGARLPHRAGRDRGAVSADPAVANAVRGGRARTAPGDTRAGRLRRRAGRGADRVRRVARAP